MAVSVACYIHVISDLEIWPFSVDLASFPGHVVKFEKSGLVSTVCTCAAPQVFLGNLETSGYYAAVSLGLSSYYRSLHAYT